ncbi:MAG: transporter [bacterium]
MLLDPASAQELEPRAYSNAPVGMNFVAATYGFSRGNILVDASLPVEDFRVTAHGVGTAYVRALNFFGMHAKVQALVPFTWLAGDLKIAGRDTSGTRTGFADARVRVAVNFIGAPALALREFRNYQQKTIAGASLVIAIPIGQYDESKRVNLGSNRWAFKPELGVSQRMGKWYLETFGGIWLFMDNTEYLNTSTLEQRPLFTVQGHVSYVFKPGLWLSVNGGYADGGETLVGGSFKNDFQKNWRIGTTFSLPIGRQHALKALFNTGAATRSGSDFDAFVVAYQYSWL